MRRNCFGETQRSLAIKRQCVWAFEDGALNEDKYGAPCNVSTNVFAAPA